MKALITKLRRGMDLTAGDVSYAMSMLLSESTDDSMKADFLIALHQKGESVEEIVAFVQQLIDRAIDPLIDAKNLPGPMLDVCGTGGDGLDLFNVSTTIMFVLAAGGVAGGEEGESPGGFPPRRAPPPPPPPGPRALPPPQLWG